MKRTPAALALDAEAFAAALGITKRTLLRKVKCGLLPQPVRLGHRILRWPPSAVDLVLHGDRSQGA